MMLITYTCSNKIPNNKVHYQGREKHLNTNKAILFYTNAS